MKTLIVDLDGVYLWRTTFWTHDLALDGDEDLHVGERVLLTDGVVTMPSTVVRRDDAAGYWFYEVDGE